jgi:hypothetical protein
MPVGIKPERPLTRPTLDSPHIHAPRPNMTFHTTSDDSQLFRNVHTNNAVFFRYLIIFHETAHRWAVHPLSDGYFSRQRTTISHKILIR